MQWEVMHLVHILTFGVQQRVETRGNLLSLHVGLTQCWQGTADFSDGQKRAQAAILT